MSDLVGYVIVVGIYVALAALCLWGAVAWDSLFMLILSGVWGFMALFWVAWFVYVQPDES